MSLKSPSSHKVVTKLGGRWDEVGSKLWLSWWDSESN